MKTELHLERAIAFMKRGARQLERARYEYEFEGGNKDSVLHALKQYQNEDEGFGRGTYGIVIPLSLRRRQRCRFYPN